MALLIGVDDYQGGIPKLSSPAKDVQEVGRIMKDKFGYEVRTVLNADKARIVHELNRLILESNDDDSIAIMYAGHGHLVEKTQRGYWIPGKASADDPKQWISNQDIARALGNISAKQIFLVSDSCYSGTLTREAKIDRTDIPPDPQAVLERRSVTALSSGGDEPVADEGKDGHSVFAWHLMEQLKAVKDVSLGVGVYEQIAESVKAEIPQTPQYGASPSSGHQRGGDYLFEIRQYPPVADGDGVARLRFSAVDQGTCHADNRADVDWAASHRLVRIDQWKAVGRGLPDLAEGGAAAGGAGRRGRWHRRGGPENLQRATRFLACELREIARRPGPNCGPRRSAWTWFSPRDPTSASYLAWTRRCCRA